MMIGWDIGGAHLKAVQIDAAGKVHAAMQVYCPLWCGLFELERAFDTILSTFSLPPPSGGRDGVGVELKESLNIHPHPSLPPVMGKEFQHCITMTGELADIFENRHAGVAQIAQLARQKLGENIQFYAGEQGFVSFAQVKAHTSDIASMNWLASVQFIAQNVRQALFLDIGSTTTDIVLIHDGKPQIQGFNDAKRLQTDELVYTGVVRTSLMALAQKIAFNGHWVNVAAEHFATTADVYTLTGDLAFDENMAETADGADKGLEASAKRIARMVGMDSADAPLGVWRNLAYAFKHAQINLIKHAVLRQVSRLEEARGLHLIGCGAGDFLAYEIAQQLGFRYHSVTDLIAAKNTKTQEMTAVCFPAFAVARLSMTSVES